MYVGAVGGPQDELTMTHARGLRRHEMAVLLPAKVPCVEDLHSRYLNYEPGGHQDMTNIVTPEIQLTLLFLLEEVYRIYLVHVSLQTSVSVQHLLSGDVGNLDVVGEQPEEDGLGGLSEKNI